MIDDFHLMTKRLCLRTPCSHDAAALQVIAGDKRVARITASIPHPYPAGEAENRIELIRSMSGGNRCSLAITLISSAQFIGMIGFSGTSACAELTYMISPYHWNHGYATEAASAIVTHIFAATPFEAITASARIDNPSSEAVLWKAGFRKERVADIAIPLRGIVAPVSFWRLDAPVAESI